MWLLLDVGTWPPESPPFCCFNCLLSPLTGRRALLVVNSTTRRRDSQEGTWTVRLLSKLPERPVRGNACYLSTNTVKPIRWEWQTYSDSCQSNTCDVKPIISLGKLLKPIRREGETYWFSHQSNTCDAKPIIPLGKPIKPILNLSDFQNL